MGKIRLESILPGAKWFREYTVQFAVADFIAGVTVGLTVLPQALAYATLAGLPPQFGLYSAFAGCIVYAVMGGCRELTIGPTALLALMVKRHTDLGGESGPDLAILLCLLSGIMELIIAFLRLGVLVDLISLPVTVGFTSATAIIIATSQLKGLLGLRIHSGSGFIETITSIVTNLDKAQMSDTVLGISCLAFALIMRKLKDIKFGETRGKQILTGIFWTLSISRNALIVLLSSVGAFIALHHYGESPFILTGTIKSGLPGVALPNFQTTRNTTEGIVPMTTADMFSELGSSIVLVPIIAILGNVAISKAFGGSNIDATRELIALATSNIIGSFFSSIPVTGSFSRSAVNHSSGVKTPIGGVYTAFLVLVALGVLTPYFQYIPRAALAAVIISAVIFMIEYEIVRPLWRCSRRELFPGAVTFILSLCYGVEIGLLAGVVTDLGFLVHRAARPILIIDHAHTPSGIEYIMIRPSHCLVYFPAVEWLRNSISRAVKMYGILPIVLDCQNVHEFDFTAARGLGSIEKELTAMGSHLVLLGQHEAVRQMLVGALSTTISEANNEEQLNDVLHQLCVQSKIENGGPDVSIPLLYTIKDIPAVGNGATSDNESSTLRNLKEK